MVKDTCINCEHFLFDTVYFECVCLKKVCYIYKPFERCEHWGLRKKGSK